MPNESGGSSIDNLAVALSPPAVLWAVYSQAMPVISPPRQSDQRLALPHLSVPDIRWVNWDALAAAGFRGCVFDKDNTLTGGELTPLLCLAVAEGTGFTREMHACHVKERLC